MTVKAEKTMSSILSSFIDQVYETFGADHKFSRQANAVVLAFTDGADDEELAGMVQNIITDFDQMNKK